MTNVNIQKKKEKTLYLLPQGISFCQHKTLNVIFLSGTNKLHQVS